MHKIEVTQDPYSHMLHSERGETVAKAVAEALETLASIAGNGIAWSTFEGGYSEGRRLRDLIRDAGVTWRESTSKLGVSEALRKATQLREKAEELLAEALDLETVID